MDRIVGGAYSMEDEEVGGGPVGGKVVGGARVGGRVVGGARVGGRVVGGAKRKLGRMLGKMSDEDMTMLRDVVKMSDQELEGSGFYSAMGRSFVDRIRPLLGETGTTHPVVQGAGEAEMNVVEMVGDGVTGGGRIGGGRIGGGRIGGGRIGGASSSAAARAYASAQRQKTAKLLSKEGVDYKKLSPLQQLEAVKKQTQKEQEALQAARAAETERYRLEEERKDPFGTFVKKTVQDPNTIKAIDAGFDVLSKVPLIGEVVKPLKMAKDLAFQVSGLRGKGRKVSDKMKKRGDLIKKLMKEKKLSLAEASKYIKEHKLM